MGERRSRRRCHTPTKDRYHKRAEAEAAARMASASYQWPIEAYQCQCGVWHITRVKPEYLAVRPVDSGHARGIRHVPPPGAGLDHAHAGG